MLDAVMSLLTYNGVFFVGLTGALITDYYRIRRQVLSTAHFFTRSHMGIYWCLGGVNWLAFVVIAATTGLYLAMCTLVSGTVSAAFHAMGAASPVVPLPAEAYLGLARLFKIGIKTTPQTNEQVSVEI